MAITVELADYVLNKADISHKVENEILGVQSIGGGSCGGGGGGGGDRADTGRGWGCVRGGKRYCHYYRACQ